MFVLLGFRIPKTPFFPIPLLTSRVIFSISDPERLAEKKFSASEGEKLKKMDRGGFEPSTERLRVACSTTELTIHK